MDRWQKVSMAGFGVVGLVFAGWSGSNYIQSLDGKKTPIYEVTVQGEVKTPGNYELKPGSTVKDALNAAGGATRNADIATIPLSEKVLNGTKITIVSINNEGLFSQVLHPTQVTSLYGGSTTRGSSQNSSQLAAQSGPISINSASQIELESLPKIGPAIAQRILQYRAQNGPFRSIEELVNVKGIGPKTMDALRPYVKL